METTERFPVVGIGASAGGVEALQAFFRAMPDPPPAMAFVVVTHLGANQESALPAIVEKSTAMPVVPMRDGETLRPGHAYVASHEALITVADRRLVLSGTGARQPRERQPIDLLFASLAADLGELAIGIVLSGSGSDGTLGLKAIKEAGGLTLAQGSNGTAPRYTGMPSSAVAAGAVDLVIPVEQMPGRLADLLARHKGLDAPAGAAEAGDIAAVQDEICTILRTATGHDFAGYKDKTFFRRVHRRMQVLQIDTVPAYIAELRATPDEAGRLFHDLLISVTGFFRDADAFGALEAKVMPALFEGRGADDTVRIWVPGCATGEEAYSLAILAQEQMAQRPSAPRVQIFATDIDDAALAVARTGRYPKSMMGGVSAERLARFFVSDGALFTVTPAMRELCVFSSHNVIRDAPFSRIDLVSCRNMLIYMGGRLQEQVIPLFHYALRPSGFLFLGVAETVARHSEMFAPVDKAHRIFRRRDMAVAGTMPRMQLASLTVRHHWPPPAASRERRTGSAAELRQLAAGFAAELFAPPHVLVNADGNIMHQSANLSRYLELQPGPPSQHLVSLARRGLRPELRSALREAVDTQRRVVRPRIDFDDDGMEVSIALTIAPLPRTEGQEALYIVAFVEHEVAAGTGQGPQPEGGEVPPREHVVDQLEAELRETRERLQSISEEYETATEELKSANEEMVSVNEELQSINEELETSKEELQSVNEELRASNVELSAKIEELDRANADLRNLFDSTQVATVFLDRNLVIRSFTPAVTAIFDLVPADRGRPLSSFASHLDGTDIGRDARRVIEERTPTERRVTAQNGIAHYLMRLLPYTTASGAVEGVVVTFFDITKVVEGEILGSLVDELNHRVRNMLQVVSAVSTHTLRRAASLEEFGTVFAGRIRALARAHELVSIGAWAEVPLVTLIEKELEPYAIGSDRLTTLGPPVQIRPKAALALGMVLHELATNAAKYGSLSTEGGRVTIAWAEEEQAGETRFVLRWSESGGPKPDPAPTRQGFGSELIERQIRHDLGGGVEITFAETGLVAVLSLPIGVVAEIGRTPLQFRPQEG